MSHIPAWLGFFAVVYAGAGLNVVEHVLERYRKMPAFSANLKKTVTQDVMGTKVLSHGKFYFSRGKIRVEIARPERSLVVYDGRDVWSESSLDDSTVQVSHVRAGSLKRGDSPLASLFETKGLSSKFRVVRRAVERGADVFDLAPLDPGSAGVVSLALFVRADELERVKYRDQMENTVDFELSEPKHRAVSASLFAYRPPKGALVTEMGQR